MKRAQRRGYDLRKLETIITMLQRGEALPPSNRDHPLKGDWKGYRDCHVEPDWVLIYKLTDDELRLAVPALMLTYSKADRSPVPATY
jgi:mRNA interferase YafQ